MKAINKIFIWLKDHKKISIFILLIVLFLSVAIYNNRIGIMYYLEKYLGFDNKSDYVNVEQTEEQIKPISINFKNWYIEVDLDEPDNPYKNVDLDNILISGGSGKYTINYELKKEAYSSRMLYTITDEIGNTISQSQRITYVISKNSKDKAMEAFYDIAKKYNYSVAAANQTYKDGNFSKYVNGEKIKRFINLFNQRIEANAVDSNGISTNNYCDYDVVKDYYNCILDGNNVKYEDYTELQEPMNQLIEEYNKILAEYVKAGYGYEYFIAQVKN